MVLPIPVRSGIRFIYYCNIASLNVSLIVIEVLKTRSLTLFSVALLFPSSLPHFSLLTRYSYAFFFLLHMYLIATYYCNGPFK